MIPQDIIFTNYADDAITKALATLQANKTLVLVDENTRQHVLPLLNKALAGCDIITIPAGEQHKTLDSVTHIWDEMIRLGATRQTVMVNVGGGTVTDIGAFAASTFKRGIRFINVPTTILGAVDAAVGGKTGFDYHGLKNEIGVFSNAEMVIVSSRFFDTLPQAEIKSGFAEMIKHAMLSGSREFMELLDIDLENNHWSEHLEMIERSVKTKQLIVEQDPQEQGLRRALNLGHTVGHALESLALQRGAPVTHGHAVACGLVTESVLSHMMLAFSSTYLHRLAAFVRNNYGAVNITCKDYPALLKLMKHDKKSRHGEINCTLLRDLGDVVIDNVVSDKDMETALDIYRDLMGI